MDVYYDEDASVDDVDKRTIAVIGYGSQGRAQALNLRDSGCDVVVGNIRDQYWEQAISDGFQPVSIGEAASLASVIMFLIPDQAQKNVYDQFIGPELRSDDLIIFAHGFSINYKKIVPPDDVDVCLLAPRMPGIPIRSHYLQGGGVPAFVDVHNDYTGKAKSVLLGIAKAIGFTRAGVMEVTFQEETELDLFVEQYFLPVLMGTIQTAFDLLVEENYKPMPALLELYASGELGELMLLSSKMGIYKVWVEQASPTCRYGIFKNHERVIDKKQMRTMMRAVIQEIKDGSFVCDLEEEGTNGYQNLKSYDDKNDASLLMNTQRDINKAIKL